MVTVEPKVLFDIIQKQRATLHGFSLHKVSLLQSDKSRSPRENLWARFFGQLYKLDLKLTSMKMSLLSQTSSLRQLSQVTFMDSKDPNSREWGGTDVQSCLRDFIANVILNSPESDSNSSNNGDGVDFSGK
jgi:hypothetical protein